MPKVLLERRGRVAIVTLDNDERRNALSFEMRQGLREAFDEFDADGSIGCVVLTANGRAFCAGADLKEMAQLKTTIPPPEFALLIGSKGSIAKPVIAAVNGAALAGGFALVQECDLVVASTAATFAITEVHRGRGAPWATPLISMMGQRHMMELLLTGRPISAERAAEFGFVNHVVPPEELLERALSIAEVIAGAAPISVRAAKELVRTAAEVGVAEARQRAEEIYEPVYLSQDAQEGPLAFAEKRDPVWTGT